MRVDELTQRLSGRLRTRVRTARGHWVACMLVLPLLSGCLADGPPRGPGDDGSGAASAGPVIEEGPDESSPPQKATFPGADGAPPVVGLLWLPQGEPSAVVVGVPGGCGAKDTLGPRDLPGYSTAHRFTATGRAFVSIDRPGVGESGALPGGNGIEGATRALKSVADALRSGTYATDPGEPIAFARVVGFGTSCGAMVTEVAQGLHAPYDAIVATAWVNTGIHEDARPCFPSCPPDVWFHAAGTDARIMAAEWDAFNATDAPNDEPLPDVVGLSDFVVWFGCAPGPDGLVCAESEGVGTPARERALAAVTVPILIVAAAEDRLIAPTTAAAETARFGSEDATFVAMANTGHVMLLHVSLPSTVATADEWLRARGL